MRFEVVKGYGEGGELLLQLSFIWKMKQVCDAGGGVNDLRLKSWIETSITSILAWRVTHDMFQFPQTSSLFFVDAKFEFWSFLFYGGCWTWGLQTSFWRSTWSLSQETFFECLDLSNFWPLEKMSVKELFAKASTKSIIEGDEGWCLTRSEDATSIAMY